MYGGQEQRVVTAQIRDIAIIIIAVQSIVIGVLIAVLILQIWRLIKMVQTEIKPIVEDAQETLSTVRGTTNFMSSNVVEPVVKTGGYIAGARRTAKVMQNELNATMRTFGRRSNRQPSAAPPPESPASEYEATGSPPEDSV
jgi:hypothetical protein